MFHNKIGFSNGVIHRILDKYANSSIDIFKKFGNGAIEICLYDCSETEKLANIVEEIKNFSHKSIHLPTNNIVYKNDQQTNELLVKIKKLYSEIGANLSLVHPHLVEDWDVFGQYDGINWAIENMDVRKDKYKTAGELKEFFAQNPNWKLVLDLNHCYSNDKTMKLAEDIIVGLKDKIAQIHLSGCLKLHEPLFQTKQNFIVDYCKKMDVPIIIESIFDSVEDIKQEFNYIVEHLVKKVIKKI